MKDKISNFLILLPFIWISTGMLILRNGDKIMVAAVIISLITTLLTYGLVTFKNNISTNKILWLLFIICGYFLFSDYYHGLSSREIRAFICSLIFIAIFPSQYLTRKVITKLTIIAAFISCGFSYYCMVYMKWGRGTWPINAIPYATLIASISLISLSLFLSTKIKKEKILTSFAFILSTAGLIITESRGLWLGFTITVIVICFSFIKINRLKISVRYIAIITIVITGVFFICKPFISQRLSQTEQEYSAIKSGNLNTSIGQRLQMWKSAPLLINNHEILGQGKQYIKSLEQLYYQGKISLFLYQSKPPHLHNQYIDYLVKKGYLGLILLICIFYLPLTQLKNNSILQSYITISLVTLYIIASLTDVPLNHGQCIFMYLFWIGCFSTISKSNNEHLTNV